MSAHRARRTGRPSLGRSAGRRIVRDPHAVQATLIPLASAVILMGNWTPSAAPGQARARIQACGAQAAHRRAILAVVHV